MNIDSEGHFILSPREVAESISNPQKLVNSLLIPGTPRGFPTYKKYCDFLNACAIALGIHPRNLLIRGSTKIGFSLKPRSETIWVEMHSGSDLDLAIIVPDYYHYFDREIRMYERDPENDAFRGRQLHKSISRKEQRSFYTYRSFDLPSIPCVDEHNKRLRSLPIEECCGQPRTIDAFIFRDWWSLYARWESDIRNLDKGIKRGTLCEARDEPRLYDDLN